ncbi:MAG TPA: hypothetical protein VJN18_32260 [Polyangiaceae bacterium]|nr:hypothetical protein [Polyangiaceae bacterium]
MTWAFLDDHGHENEKLQEIGGAAAWYWACGLMYCRRMEPKRAAQKKRFDFIPTKAALALFPDPKAKQHIKELLRVGLWHAVVDGYIVNDYREVYGNDGTTPGALQPAGPAAVQPTPSQLGGKARAGTASRGPAGRFQPSQPRARQFPDPDPETTEQATAKDLKDSARGEPASQPAAAAAVFKMTLAERASALLQSPALARDWQPQRWPELLEFAQAIEATWQPISLGPYGRDPLVALLVDELAGGLDDTLLAAAGDKIGRWLAEASPDGRARSLNMVTYPVLRKALEEVQSAERLTAGADELIRLAQSSPAEGAA